MEVARVPEGERRENMVLDRSGMLIQPLDERVVEGEIEGVRGSSKPKSLQIRVGKAREKK